MGVQYRGHCSFCFLITLPIGRNGRVKHFISAFGEHVIGKEVETAMKQAIEDTDIRIKEFTVAPQISPSEGLPYHEWLVEFENQPENLEAFALALDQVMQQQNVYLLRPYTRKGIGHWW